MLIFICMDFDALWWTGGERKIKNENMCPAGFETATFHTNRILTMRLKPIDHTKWDD